MQKKLLTPNECADILSRISSNVRYMTQDVNNIISAAKLQQKIVYDIHEKNTKYLKKMKNK